MDRFNNQMLFGIDKGTFSLSIGTPENENQIFFSIGQTVNDGIGKLFPALILVRTGLVGTDSESGIEQQNAFFDPMIQIAGFGRRFTNISLDFFINILQGGRKGDAVGDRKRKTVGLARAMIGVLTKDDDLDLVDRQTVERVENKLGWRIDSGFLIFLMNEPRERLEVGFLKFVFEKLFP